MAPSKLFRIKEQPVVPRDERDQANHLDWLYNTKSRSIQAYFREKFYVPSLTAGGMSVEQVDDEMNDHIRLLAENDEENKRVASQRKERLTIENELIKNDLLEADLTAKMAAEEKLDEAKAIVDAEVRRSATFITMDTLEKAIEEALQNPVNYEFAIDKKGQIVNDGKVHPYAYNPSAIPETSSNTAELATADQKKKFRERKIY